MTSRVIGAPANRHMSKSAERRSQSAHLQVDKRANHRLEVIARHLRCYSETCMTLRAPQGRGNLGCVRSCGLPQSLALLRNDTLAVSFLLSGGRLPWRYSQRHKRTVIADCAALWRRGIARNDNQSFHP